MQNKNSKNETDGQHKKFLTVKITQTLELFPVKKKNFWNVKKILSKKYTGKKVKSTQGFLELIKIYNLLQ